MCLFNHCQLPENFMISKSVMLGYRGNNDIIFIHVFNLAKYYIFVTKCRERTLNFELFKVCILPSCTLVTIRSTIYFYLDSYVPVEKEETIYNILFDINIVIYLMKFI